MKKNSPSRTAKKVALNILALNHLKSVQNILPAKIIEDTSKVLINAGLATENVIKLAKSNFSKNVYLFFDFMMPGQFAAFAYRKKFCDDGVRKAIKEKASQVLVLGAGYDTLCLRLSKEFPNVKFIEIDHPATAEYKQKAIKSIGKTENFYLIPSDLGQNSLVEVLENSPVWSNRETSVIVAEGLLMYLAEDAVKDLFSVLNEISGHNSTILFTYIGKGEDGEPELSGWAKLALYLLKLTGEPWLWWIKPKELEGFFKESAWKVNPKDLSAPNKRGVEYFARVKK